MIDLAFNESLAGVLKMIKNSKNDIIILNLYLDIGDISDLDTGMHVRKCVLDGLFAKYPDVSDEIWRANLHAIGRLREAKNTLEPVRVWVCLHNPSDLCSLYFVSKLLKDSGVPLLVVCIPSEIEKEDCIVSYHSTGEIHPETLAVLQRYEEWMSGLKRTVYANIWNGLVRENAPLRAVVNGTLMSAPVDFYDFALRANMPEGEFTIAMLIGRTLNYTPGIGDLWLYIRAESMLQSGELVMVREAVDHHYSAIVRRNQIN